MSEGCCLVQVSDQPVFEGSEATDNHLYCSSGCGQMLVRNYYPDSFVSINFVCYTCKAVTKTPDIEAGEVLSSAVLSVGTEGSYLIGGTVIYKPTLMIAGGKAIEDAIRNSAPQGLVITRQLNADLLEYTKAQYIAVTGVDYDKQRHIVSKGGKGVEFEYPLVWAIEEIRSSFAGSILFNTPGLRYSIAVIALFNSIYDRWNNSFRFKEIAKQFGAGTKFFHTAFTFIVADHFYQAGNKIGLSLERDHGVSNPDLYIRLKANEKFYMEVKTPALLQLTAGTIDRSKIKSAMYSAVKRSSPQISKLRPGILVLGTSMPDPQDIAELGRWRANVIKSRGRCHSGLAGLITVTRNPLGSMGLDTAYAFESSINDHFVGVNPMISKNS